MAPSRPLRNPLERGHQYLFSKRVPKVFILGMMIIIPAWSAPSDTFGGLLNQTQIVRGLQEAPPPSLVDDATPFATEASTARFLSQATFGGTAAEISALTGTGVSEWFREQFTETPFDYLQTVDEYQARLPYLFRNPWSERAATFAFWKASINGDDQLRQRMVFALSQILVISNAGNNELLELSGAVAYYQSLLTKHAFGGYRDLLEDITYAPAMGLYLTYMGNQKEDPATDRQPDENYARELLQLFTIGLIDLNDDGSPAYYADADESPVELYTNQDITGLAKVFTGLDRVDKDLAINVANELAIRASWRQPMMVYPESHSTSEKNFLGLSIPAGTDARTSIALTLDHLMNINAMGPFLSRQLIQRFTTSDPSSAYVQRVTQTFNAGQFTLPDGTIVGSRQRGDLKATLAAILLDPENVNPPDPNSYGKPREPVLRFIQWARLFADGTDKPEYTLQLYDVSSADNLGQHPYRAPSVFNFYRPGYIPPNTLSGSNGMTVPEFQLVNGTTIPGYINFITFFARGGTLEADLEIYEEFGDIIGVDFDPQLARQSFVPDYSEIEGLAGNPGELVDYIYLLMTGSLPSQDTRQTLITYLREVDISNNSTWREVRAALAVILVMTSSDYLIQR